MSKLADEEREFWNQAWAEHEDAEPKADALLADEIKGLTPGRALDLGCGVGGNAVWLVEQGWQVTAVDFSDMAIEKARHLAEKHGVEVKFLVDDASTFQSEGEFDLIATFYIQLPPEQRTAMLTRAKSLLAPSGTLLFIGHDKSKPPTGWSDQDKLTLTTPFQIVKELAGLSIERASVMPSTGGAHAEDEDAGLGELDAEQPAEPFERQTVDRHAARADSTVVRAVRPG